MHRNTDHLELSIRKQKEKKMKRSEESLHDLWDTIKNKQTKNKQNQTTHYWESQRERGRKGLKDYLKIMADNSPKPKCGKDSNNQVHEAHGFTNSTQEELIQDTVQ